MKSIKPDVDVEPLVREIQRYLVVVNAARVRRLDSIRRKRDRKEKG